MIRIAFFQPFSGISGDMTLGALVDAGLDFERLQEELTGLGLDGYRLSRETVHRGAFRATRVRVLLEDSISGTPNVPDPEEIGSDRRHESAHSLPHSHSHSHAEPERPSHGSSPRRDLRSILELIETSSLPAPVRENSCAVFRRLGYVEAHAHGVAIDKVHFHEVGAVDSIVDIVGSCLGLHILGIDEIYSGPVSVGSGWVEIAHGRVPLPAPATLELLRGVPMHQVETSYELTTPTGAALLSTLSKHFGTLPDCRPTAVGYGAGGDRPGPVPNCLRLIIAEREASPARTSPKEDRVLLLETNLDDMNPQWTGYLMDRLFSEGALDVFLTPIQMKKSRPGHQISVLLPPHLEATITGILFAESTTLGLRRREVDRVVLDRALCTVRSPWGDIRVKVGLQGTEKVNVTPEHEDLRRAAERSGRPLKEIHRRVLELYFREREKEKGKSIRKAVPDTTGMIPDPESSTDPGSFCRPSDRPLETIERGKKRAVRAEG